MGRGLGTATVFIGGDLKGLNDALGRAEKDTKRSMGNIINTARNVGYAMTGAGAAITGMLGLAVNAAAEQEKAEKQVQAVLESTKHAAGLTYEELKKLASGFQEVTVYGDEAVLGAEALMLTFTNVSRDVFPAAIETVLDMSTALGQDLKQSAIQVGKALQDPITGATALKRVGVDLNDQQRELIKTLVESGDTMGAQQVILDELAKEFGGSAKTEAEGFAGQVKQVKNAIGDVAEVIGTHIIPVLRSFIEDHVKPAIPKISDFAKEHGSLFKGLALVGGALAVGGPVLIGLASLASLTSTALGVVGALAGAIGVTTAGGLAIGITLVGALWALGDLLGQTGLWTENNPFTGTIQAGIDKLNDLMEAVRETHRFIGTIGTELFDTLTLGFRQAWTELGKFIDLLETVPGLMKAIIPGGEAGDAGAFGRALKDSLLTWTGGLRGYAGGTGYAPAGMALVGERGPELVRMRGGEQVFDAGSTERIIAAMREGRGGGQTVNFSGPITVVANNPEEFKRKLLHEERMAGGVL